MSKMLDSDSLLKMMALDNTARSRGGKIVRVGRPVMPNAAIEEKYAKMIRSAVLMMADETRRTVADVLKSESAAQYVESVAMDASVTSAVADAIKRLSARFSSLFSKLAEQKTKEMVEESKEYAKKSVSSSIYDVAGAVGIKNGIAIAAAGSSPAVGGLPKGSGAVSSEVKREAVRAPYPFEISPQSISPFEREQVKALTVQNVGLIKSIPSQYFERIQTAVTNSIVGGNPTTQILGTIRDIGNSTEKRAKFIALDQTKKANSALSMAAMRQAGFTQFMWRHSSGGQHPRKLHRMMDGKIYDIDNPPIIDERTGERGFPSQLIKCRCFAVPVFNEVQNAP